MQTDTTLWSRCVRQLQSELTEQQFNTWIRPLQAVEQDDVLRLLAPNRFVVEWLREHFLERISEVVNLADADAKVVIEVGSRGGAPNTAAPAARPVRPARR